MLCLYFWINKAKQSGKNDEDCGLCTLRCNNVNKLESDCPLSSKVSKMSSWPPLDTRHIFTKMMVQTFITSRLDSSSALYCGITDDLMSHSPVYPERCRSAGDGHSTMRPHLTSSPPAALASSVAKRRVQGRHFCPPGVVWICCQLLDWRLLPRHGRWPKNALFSSVGRRPT